MSAWPGPGWSKIRPEVYAHADEAACETEIVRVECSSCGETRLVMHALCECDDHRSSQSKPEREAAHETCCGQRMVRLEMAADGSRPLSSAEKQTAAELEAAAATEREQAVAAIALARELAERAVRRLASEEPGGLFWTL